MTDLVEDTVGKIRDLPIQDSLRKLLIKAAKYAGITLVRVTSGGQAAKGTPGKRTGSTRHDLGYAADLMLEIDGRALSFVKGSDLTYFKAFVRMASQLGATGIGAGVHYMGPLTLHVGYGDEAVWGAGGKSATAPAWLVEAFYEGKAKRGTEPAPAATVKPDHSVLAVPMLEFIAMARTGLNLRAGPGTEFPILAQLAAGTHVWSAETSAPSPWRKIDVQNDGLSDGFVFGEFLSQV